MTNQSIIRVMGFDFGTKRLGVAVGQLITKTAQPLKNIQMVSGMPNWSALDKIVHQWQPDALVVGIPLNMDGTLQPLSNLAREFCTLLATRYGLPVYETDERLTTKDARERLFKNGGYQALQDGQVDQVAAQLILENWFQTRNDAAS